MLNNSLPQVSKMDDLKIGMRYESQYSMVITCRANDFNPFYYFRHIITELPKRAPSDDESELL